MKTVVLAAGDFPPDGSFARRILDEARRVVCCDGAADAYVARTGRKPDAVVGDLDSLQGDFPYAVRVPCQDTNDLEKAVAFARKSGWSDITILGATGKREDHTLANIFKALDLGVDVVSGFGIFHVVEGRRVFRMEKGTAVSVFAPDRNTVASSRGLQWPLDRVIFRNLHCAALNKASGCTVEVCADRRILVYVACGR